jgi:hypothetical protein
MRLDFEDFLVMRALRYLDDAPLWSQNLATVEVVKSENREVLEFLLSRLGQGLPSALRPEDFPESLSAYVARLQDLAWQEPEIPAASRASEFDRLMHKVRGESDTRKLKAQAARLSEMPDAGVRDLDPTVVTDLASLRATQTELSKLSVLSHTR